MNRSSALHSPSRSLDRQSFLIRVIISVCAGFDRLSRWPGPRPGWHKHGFRIGFTGDQPYRRS